MSYFFIQQSCLTVGSCLFIFFDLFLDKVELFIQKFLVVDDLIATGGTLAATRNLIEQGGAEVTDFFGVIGLPALNYDKVLAPCKVTTLINYDGE